MAAKATHNPEFLDPDHEAIVTFGHTYFDDDDEREEFINTLMERRGYQRQASWALPPEAPQQQQQGGAPGTPAAGPRRPAYFKR